MVKLTYYNIKDSFEKEGYTLLSKEYINSKTKLNYICPNGHEHSIVWSNWLQGKRCQICSGNLKLNIDYIKKDFKKEGYTLLSEEYINSITKLHYICPEGHKHYVTWGNWQQGYRCFYCSHNLPPDINNIKRDMEMEGYKLLSDKYISAKSKMTIECSKGHIFKSCWNNWQQGKRCPICPSQQSKFEKEIKLFINNLGVTYSTNDRTVLTNPETNRSLELDLYFPELNKAIECNGMYWHSRVSAYDRDIIKKKLCLDRNIDLLIITDEEWITEKSNIENKIKLFIGGEHNG